LRILILDDSFSIERRTMGAQYIALLADISHMTSTRQQRRPPNIQIYRHSHPKVKRRLLPIASNREVASPGTLPRHLAFYREVQ
jgi:hypothetical protein